MYAVVTARKPSIADPEAPKRKGRSYAAAKRRSRRQPGSFRCYAAAPSHPTASRTRSATWRNDASSCTGVPSSKMLGAVSANSTQLAHPA